MPSQTGFSTQHHVCAAGRFRSYTSASGSGLCITLWNCVKTSVTDASGVKSVDNAPQAHLSATFAAPYENLGIVLPILLHGKNPHADRHLKRLQDDFRMRSGHLPVGRACGWHNYFYLYVDYNSQPSGIG